jgi:hypothetical protein
LPGGVPIVEGGRHADHGGLEGVVIAVGRRLAQGGAEDGRPVGTPQRGVHVEVGIEVLEDVPAQGRDGQAGSVSGARVGGAVGQVTVGAGVKR